MIRQHIEDRVVARRGRLHPFDEFDGKATALVVIDMQHTFCAPGAPSEVPAARNIVEPINRLAAALRQAGGTVIWCVHANASINGRSDWSGFYDHFVAADVRDKTVESLSPGGSGQAIWHGLDVDATDLHINKNRYSALIPGASPLDRILHSLGVDTLLICGTKTNVCCESTARDAMMLDYKVVMVADGTAALSPEEHQSALENTIQQFGDVRTADEIVQRLKM